MAIDGKINLSSIDLRSLFQRRGQVDTEKPAGSLMSVFLVGLLSHRVIQSIFLSPYRFPMYFFLGKESRKTQRWRWSVDLPDRLILRLSHVLAVHTDPLRHTLN